MLHIMPLLLQWGEEIHFFLCSRNCIIILVIISIIVCNILVVVCRKHQVKGLSNCKHEISDSLHYSIFFILFCYAMFHTDPHVNKHFFRSNFLAKTVYQGGSYACLNKLQHFNFFFRVKVDAPLSSGNVKFLLNQRREAKFVIASFFMTLNCIT